jgi:hypothetical protein
MGKYEKINIGVVLLQVKSNLFFKERRRNIDDDQSNLNLNLFFERRKTKTLRVSEFHFF